MLCEMSAGIESEILTRVIDPGNGNMSPEVARFFLGLDFSATDHERMVELSSKVQEGALTSDEEAELDGLLNVNDFLAIIQSKARRSLGGQP